MPAGFEDPGLPFYTVGQVADLLGVQQSFLRRLERHDLIRPGRSDGSQRRYSRDDIDQIGTVCGLIDEGLTLEGVRRVLLLQSEVAQLQAEVARLRRRLRKDNN